MPTISDLPLKTNDRRAIEATVKLLLSKFPVEQITLYGSKVSEESDIDLLLLTQPPLSWQERDAITDALFDLELTDDVVISTLIVASEQWMTRHYRLLPIHHEINQQGVAV